MDAETAAALAAATEAAAAAAAHCATLVDEGTMLVEGEKATQEHSRTMWRDAATLAQVAQKQRHMASVVDLAMARKRAEEREAHREAAAAAAERKSARRNTMEQARALYDQMLRLHVSKQSAPRGFQAICPRLVCAETVVSGRAGVRPLRPKRKLTHAAPRAHVTRPRRTGSAGRRSCATRRSRRPYRPHWHRAAGGSRTRMS